MTVAAYRNLVLATLGLTLTFWAWNLIAPLGDAFTTDLGLTGVEEVVLVAAPVLAGSLGQVPVGALTDRFGARVMFPLVSALTIVPVLLLIPARHHYPTLLAAGFLLGLGGTTFAIGIPLVNGWFRPGRRGLALGVFGMGMGGVALSGHLTPRIHAYDENLPYLVVAMVLAVFAMLAALMITDAPDRPVPQTSVTTGLAVAGRRPVTWELAALYAIGFGGIVAFGVYLPTYLQTWYGLDATDAGTKAAGFALVTVLFRPIGGWCSDRVHPAVVTAGALGLVALLAVVQALDPLLHPLGTVDFLGMAAGLGAASGSVFALVPRVTPQHRIGSVTGIVGAMGGLGGFVPPLVMGAVYSGKGSYAVGFMLLSDLALAGCVYAFGRMRTTDADTTRTPDSPQ
ncbi:MFS transporter [Streptomyces halobius]|uniref:MFS transporter n=1 Tax=Streptomyces halobius TaxID=2879846 RepID=A0ABY4M2K0_9ACTN|nr:MFS transporter [Streptomyces halobius]UQA91687.1 MFS transporter [Streptomyces halobius]